MHPPDNGQLTMTIGYLTRATGNFTIDAKKLMRFGGVSFYTMPLPVDNKVLVEHKYRPKINSILTKYIRR